MSPPSFVEDGGLPHKEVTLVLRFEQLRLLERLVDEGAAVADLDVRERGSLDDLQHLLSSRRRHAEATFKLAIPLRPKIRSVKP